MSLRQAKSGREVNRDSIEVMLAQAAAFARAEDYLGAQARARAALAQSPDGDGSLEHQAIELAIGRYDALVAAWQAQNTARHAAYLKRERAAIGAEAEGSVLRDSPCRRSWARVVRLVSRRNTTEP